MRTLAALALSLLASLALAHPGKLDADGCHMEQQSHVVHCHPERANRDASAQAVEPDAVEGKVVAVADGDTLRLRDADGKMYVIRLQGIDAPESRQDHGRESTNALAANSILSEFQLVRSNLYGLIRFRIDDSENTSCFLLDANA